MGRWKAKKRGYCAKVPDETASSITHKFDIAGDEGYITAACMKMVSREKSLSPCRKRARDG